MLNSTPAHIVAAVRWMTVSLFAFTLIAIAGRGAALSLTTLDIMFYRSWLGVTILAVLQYAGGRRVIDLRTQQFKLITLRSAVHFVAQWSWLSALTLIPLTQLFAIEFTAPVWTALLAPLFLRERLSSIRLAAAALGFIGILVVVRPVGLAIGAGTIYAFTAAVGFAFYFLMTKRLTRGDSPFLLLCYQHAIQAVIASVMVIGRLKVPDVAAAGWVVALTVIGLAAHFALTKAFSLADAIIVAPMDFLRLPLVAVVGVALYHEPLEPLIAAGAALIVGANVLNIWGERRAAHKKSDQAGAPSEAG